MWFWYDRRCAITFSGRGAAARKVGRARISRTEGCFAPVYVLGMKCI